MERPAIAHCLFTETHFRMMCVREHLLEARTPLAQRTPAKIIVALAEQVERDECDRSGGAER